MTFKGMLTNGSWSTPLVSVTSVFCSSFSLLPLCTLRVGLFSSRRRHTRYWRDWSSDVCSSDLAHAEAAQGRAPVLVEAAHLLQDPRPLQDAERLGDLEGDAAGDAGERGGVLELQQRPDRKSVVEGESVDLGGRRIIKKNRNAHL